MYTRTKFTVLRIEPRALPRLGEHITTEPWLCPKPLQFFTVKSEACAFLLQPHGMLSLEMLLGHLCGPRPLLSRHPIICPRHQAPASPHTVTDSVMRLFISLCDGHTPAFQVQYPEEPFFLVLQVPFPPSSLQSV